MGRPAKVIRLLKRVESGADDKVALECCVGNFRSPEEFAKDMQSVKHPIDQDPNLHENLDPLWIYVCFAICDVARFWPPTNLARIVTGRNSFA